MTNLTLANGSIPADLIKDLADAASVPAGAVEIFSRVNTNRALITKALLVVLLKTRLTGAIATKEEAEGILNLPYLGTTDGALHSNSQLAAFVDRLKTAGETTGSIVELFHFFKNTDRSSLEFLALALSDPDAFRNLIKDSDVAVLKHIYTGALAAIAKDYRVN